jgi:predicted acylesterase/phospholipase RssA
MNEKSRSSKISKNNQSKYLSLSCINALCLSGGGENGYVLLGALHKLDEIGLLPQIRSFSGSSIGAVICSLILLGAKPLDIYESSKDVNSLDLGLINPQVSDNEAFRVGCYLILSNLTMNWSILGSNPIISNYKGFLSDRLRELARDTGSGHVFNVETMLMSDLRVLTGKELHIITTNLSEMFEEDLNTARDEVLIIDAVRMTTAIPFIFPKVVVNGKLYADGCLLNRFPLKYVDNGVNNVLGINILTEYDKESQNLDIKSYISRVINVASYISSNKNVENCSDRCKIMNINCTNFPFISTSVEPKVRDQMFVHGYKSASEWVEELEFKLNIKKSE